MNRGIDIVIHALIVIIFLIVGTMIYDKVRNCEENHERTNHKLERIISLLSGTSVEWQLEEY